MKTVLVIGGGITGLTTMYELHKWKQENQSDVRLILVEANPELGGKIRTVRKGDFLMESGADSMVTRKAISLPLLEELGLEKEIVYNATGRSFIYTEGELNLIPADSVFGVPASIESLAQSPLISAEGKVEALKDFYTKNESFSKDDSIGEFLEYFFGKELVEKQIAPVLSGVYSGDLTDLTIARTLPFVLEYKEQYGSIIKGLEANKEKFQSDSGKKFISFKNGLGALLDKMEDTLEHAVIYKNTAVSKINQYEDRYQVMLSNQDTIEADHIVLSIPHNAAAQLLDNQRLQEEFSGLKNSSLISVYMGFDLPDHVLPADGTGFITANNNELSCNACTWTSRKWEHTSSKHNLLVRLFYKSSHPSYASLKEMNEAQIIEVALEDIRKSLGITAQPVESLITPWVESMPNYVINHGQKVDAIEKQLAASYPGIVLAGCSYYGVGIPDCIENGVETAKMIIDTL